METQRKIELLTIALDELECTVSCGIDDKKVLKDYNDAVSYLQTLINDLKKFMTDEEKAKQIARGLTVSDDYPYDYHSAFAGAMQAMKWKENQLIDKCKEFCNKQTIGEYYNRRGVFQIDKYIDDMLNFIKGENGRKESV